MSDSTADSPRPGVPRNELLPMGSPPADVSVEDSVTFVLPYDLTRKDFAVAAQAVDGLIKTLNQACASRGLDRIEELLTTPATLTALISDVFAGALARASACMVVNGRHNGHPDLVPRGYYPEDVVQSGAEGVEVKATKNRVSDAHGARGAWWCQVRYKVDKGAPRVGEHIPTYVDEILMARLTKDDFRKNDRNTDTGTRTATPAAAAVRKLEAGQVYKRATPPAPGGRRRPASGSTS